VRYIVILFIVFIACKPQKVELIIDQALLVDIVVDLYYAEAAVKDLGPELKDSLIGHYKQQISEIHSVDIGTVEQDLLLLQSDSKRYKAFHKIVEDSIAVRLKETEKNKIQKKEKK
jgi:hypothetical protein